MGLFGWAYVLLIHQHHRQTDGRRDRRTTCDTALCSASRGKTLFFQLCSNPNISHFFIHFLCT